MFQVLAGWARFLWRLSVTAPALTVLFAMGAATYRIIYAAVMPTHAVQSPAHFDYDFVMEWHRAGPYRRYMDQGGGMGDKGEEDEKAVGG